MTFNVNKLRIYVYGAWHERFRSFFFCAFLRNVTKNVDQFEQKCGFDSITFVLTYKVKTKSTLLIKMKYFVCFIWFIIPLCRSNNLVCQLFDQHLQSLKLYCENSRRMMSENCSSDFNVIEPSQVTQLTIGGCDYKNAIDTINDLKHVHLLDLSYSGYQHLDWLDLRLEQLKSFNASHNDIETIPWHLLKKSNELVDLDLSYNKLTTINSPILFYGTHKLKTFHLSHNAIEAIEPDVIDILSHLEYLDLRFNRFRRIPILMDNHNIKSIHLDGNPFDSYFNCFQVPKEQTVSLFFSWQHIITFNGSEYCEGRRFNIVRDDEHEGILLNPEGYLEIHCNIHSLKNVLNFIGGHNSFENIIDVMHFFYSTVETIDLSNNFIGNSLSANAFDRLIKLSRLSLSKTQLSNFDVSVVRKPKQLLDLDISHNQLLNIKNARLLDRYENLQMFNVAGNLIDNIPEIIRYLKSSIQQLNLSGNFVGSLNATTFSHLTQLTTLILRNTGLSILDGNPFHPLTALSTLDVSQNGLKDVDMSKLSSTLKQLKEFRAVSCQIINTSEMFQHFGPSIEILDLSGNFIGILNANAFVKLHNLAHLNLSHTYLQRFDFTALQNQMNLHTLDLSYNKLREVSLGPLLKYHCLRNLHLEGNDLMKIDTIVSNCAPYLSIGIEKNRFSCRYLKFLKHYFNDLEYIGNPLDQKHGHDCQSSMQAINDFLTAVYDTIKFW